MARAILAAVAAMLLVAATDGRTSVADLGWMSGHWESARDEAWAEEHWLAPRAGLMIGVGRTGRGTSLGDWEYLRLEADAQGVPVYWASPRGRPAVGFRLVRAGASSVVFENPAHDFPQRIAYRRIGRTMTATVSASDGGNATSWTFQLR